MNITRRFFGLAGLLFPVGEARALLADRVFSTPRNELHLRHYRQAGSTSGRFGVLP